MNRFAHLLDRLVYESRRNAKLRLMADYFSHTPDPERGLALAALTGVLSFREAKPNVIRTLVEDRVDPVLFHMSYDYVGDLAETAALIWPGPNGSRTNNGPHAEARAPASLEAPRDANPDVAQAGASFEAHLRRAPQDEVGGAKAPGSPKGPHAEVRASVSLEAPRDPRPEPAQAGTSFDARPWRVPQDEDGAASRPGLGHNNPPGLSLSEVVQGLATTSKAGLPTQIARWLDQLDETGRWALLKLITGELRVGVSARLAKTAVASLSERAGAEPVTPDAVEEVWHGLKPPYEDLFAWVEGHGARPHSHDPAPFRPPMLSHPVEEDEDFQKLDPAEFCAEWKWDGIRLQAVAGRAADGRRVARIYSRTGEDVSPAFPDLVAAIDFEGVLDGELLILREGRVQSFNVLQQRLNRKAVTPKLVAEYPAHLRAYDLLADGDEDLRPLPFAERRRRLEAFVAGHGAERIDLSPLVPFSSWEELAEARRNPAAVGAGEDADAIEGCMIKRAASPYLPGRPKGHWYKWKRDPYLVDAVMMYAQRGHGKRSSFYSDYTFGVWRDGAEEELVPVGKAYHGFTDQELQKLDRFVRNHTVNRFGPVREVEYGTDKGLVLEVAFEGLQRSTRHKSGVAMRFPRISRIRWDKPAAEADRIEFLEKILAKGERELHPLQNTQEA